LEVFFELESAFAFQDRDTIFFGAAWVNRRFKHNVIAFFQNLAHCGGSAQQWAQVGLVMLVNRRWYGYNEKPYVLKVSRIGCEMNIAPMKGLGAKFIARINVVAHHFNPLLIDIKADYLDFLCKF